MNRQTMILSNDANLAAVFNRAVLDASVLQLISSTSKDTDFEIAFSILLKASEAQSYEVIAKMLLNRHFIAFRNRHDFLFQAIAKGYSTSVTLLLSSPRIDSSTLNHKALALALMHGRFSIAATMLHDSNCRVSGLDRLTLLALLRKSPAAAHHHVMCLLASGNCSSLRGHESQLLTASAGAGYAESVIRLLQDPNIDPSAKQDAAIACAAAQGQLAIVRILMNDRRVNPAAKNNRALQEALQNDHSDVALQLLECTRVRALVSDPRKLRHDLVNKHRIKNIIGVIRSQPKFSFVKKA